MWLFVLFVAVPLIEIALFIQVGGWLGLWTTLLIVVLTAVLGTMLVRGQGLLALSQLQRSFRELRDPTEPLAHGAMILFSGALLLTPGFFTDAVGFSLLIPGVRGAVYRYIRSRVSIRGFSASRSQTSKEDDVIETDYEEVEIRPGNSDKPSGWTKH
jgi:UPF0716 protein FxsA